VPVDCNAAGIVITGCDVLLQYTKIPDQTVTVKASDSGKTLGQAKLISADDGRKMLVATHETISSAEAKVLVCIGADDPSIPLQTGIA
jgi:hypothetical protein